jgi:1-acyl-sn-glycerol-3-phosphate acyltransferase
MLNSIGHYWRVFATGVGFLVFGTGGIGLRLLVFPALNLFIRERPSRIVLARHVIRVAFRGFIDLMRLLGVLRYDIRGLERLQRGGLLILANHPTLIDTVFLMAFVKNADCIVNSRLWHNPFTRGPVRAAGYSSNEGGVDLIENCIASLRSGNNLIIFPEGTRTPKHGGLHFKRGAANIAVRGRYKVTPVVIHCTPPALSKGDKWWSGAARWVQFSLEIQEDIDVRPFIAETGNEVLSARHLTTYLQDYFTKESERHAAA